MKIVSILQRKWSFLPGNETGSISNVYVSSLIRLKLAQMGSEPFWELSPQGLSSPWWCRPWWASCTFSSTSRSTSSWKMFVFKIEQFCFQFSIFITASKITSFEQATIHPETWLPITVLSIFDHNLDHKNPGQISDALQIPKTKMASQVETTLATNNNIALTKHRQSYEMFA